MELMAERPYGTVIWRRLVGAGAELLRNRELDELASRCWVLLGVEDGTMATDEAFVIVWVEGRFQCYSVRPTNGGGTGVESLGEDGALLEALDRSLTASEAREGFRRGALQAWNRNVASRVGPMTNGQGLFLTGLTKTNLIESELSKLNVGEADVLIRMLRVLTVFGQASQNVRFLKAMGGPMASQMLVWLVLRHSLLGKGRFNEAKFIDQCIRQEGAHGLSLETALAYGRGERSAGEWLDGNNKLVAAELPPNLEGVGMVRETLESLMAWGIVVQDMDDRYRTASNLHVYARVLERAASELKWPVAFAVAESDEDEDGVVRRGLPVPLVGVAEGGMFARFDQERKLPSPCLVARQSFLNVSAARWGLFLALGGVSYRVEPRDLFDVFILEGGQKIVVVPDELRKQVVLGDEYWLAKPLEDHADGMAAYLETTREDVTFAECVRRDCEHYGPSTRTMPHGCAVHREDRLEADSKARRGVLDQHPLEMGFVAALLGGFGRLPDGRVTLVNVPGFGVVKNGTE